MDDWSAPAPEPHEILGPQRLVRSAAADARGRGRAGGVPRRRERARDRRRRGRRRAGLGRARRARRAARRAGVPGAVRRRGRLPAGPPAVRRASARRAARACATALAPYDAVLVVGTGALRQYPYDAGPADRRGTRVAVVTADPEEAHRSPAELAVLGDPARRLRGARRGGRRARAPTRGRARAPRRRRSPASRSAPGHVLARARRAPPARRDPGRGVARPAGPSCTRASRPAAPRASSARWACSASRCPRRSGCGWRARTARWSRSSATAPRSTRSRRCGARRTYGAGVLFIVLRNGGYAIMDRLAERAGAPGPWPTLDAVDIAAMARAQGCEARRITTHAELLAELDDAPSAPQHAAPARDHRRAGRILRPLVQRFGEHGRIALALGQLHRHQPGELGAAADVELAVDLAEVVLDRLG